MRDGICARHCTLANLLVFQVAVDEGMPRRGCIARWLSHIHQSKFIIVFQFARQNKVYWIVPFVLILGLVVLLVFTSQATAPFIYTLF